ncbi:hypothetical protein BDD43_2467 [Mucilaginibacter gracilis]|uniref:Outer membrane protein with beta-barrel domain n=1 Tax=Mucilaginibacter gracilis TaxID=423350 RepID=A0A495J0Z8_9SPHI|nr:hypothetical protein [Mucilaginibacter gracilis]RKR82291.1 hypothetical protein BDD43_2467 [Mucilaginibacter gracilis]
MKQPPILIHKKTYYLIVFVFFAVTLFNLQSGYAQQADYYYQRNNTGIRVNAGIGFTTLVTHFANRPLNEAFLFGGDYDFSAYFSVGIEGQFGTLQGSDESHNMYYQSSTDQYFASTANIRLAPIGALFSDGKAHHDFQEYLYRLYLGVGIGVINVQNTLEKATNPQTPAFGTAVPNGTYMVIPFNLGTVIDLPGLFGRDRISLNPNFQVNYVNSTYLDGFQTVKSSLSLYRMISLKVKFKFWPKPKPSLF